VNSDQVAEIRRLDVKSGEVLVVELRSDITHADFMLSQIELGMTFADAGIRCVVMRQGDAKFTVVAGDNR